MKQYLYTILLIIATILIIGTMAWVKRIEVAMPTKKNIIVKYNDKLSSVAERTKR